MRKNLIFILLFILTGCTDFKDQKITNKNIIEIQTEINVAKKVTPDEAKQFMLGATALVRKQGNVFGKTVKEVIEEGKKSAGTKTP